jgi:hypothetical protein
MSILFILNFYALFGLPYLVICVITLVCNALKVDKVSLTHERHIIWQHDFNRKYPSQIAIASGSNNC